MADSDTIRKTRQVRIWRTISPMAQALLSLYRSSGGRDWLKQAESTLAFIDANFRAADGWLLQRAPDTEKCWAARWPYRCASSTKILHWCARLTWLTALTANERYKQLSQYAMRYAAAPAVRRVAAVPARIDSRRPRTL